MRWLRSLVAGLGKTVRGIPAPLRWALALCGLHALSVCPFPWEPGLGLGWLRPSPDLLLVLGIGCACGLGRGYRAWVGHVLALMLLVALVYRFGSSAVLNFYQKEFDLYNDVLMIPGLVHLLTHKLSDVARISAIVGVGVVALLVHLMIYGMLRAVIGRGASRGRLWALVGVAQLLVGAAWLLEIERKEAPTRLERVNGRGEETPGGGAVRQNPLLGASAYGDAATQVGKIIKGGLWRYREYWLARTNEALARLNQTPLNVEKLAGVDVFLVFVESYGRVVFETEAGQRAAAGWVPALEAALREKGFEMGTAYAAPSVFGGQSNLAHAELLSGAKVETKRIFDLLIKGWLKPLPKFFQEAGHLTVNVHPIMPTPWPEGRRFYGFDQEVFKAQLPYEGIDEALWAAAPDQFALAHVLEKVVRPSSRPVFAMYVSVTSHVPFSVVPRYFEDWSEALRPGAYAGRPARKFPLTWYNFSGHPQLEEAYLETIHYSLRAATGLLLNHDRPALMVILGDHQPPAIGDPRRLGAGANDVPIHVISNRHELLLPLVKRGYQRGLRPASDAASFHFSEFLYDFLSDFGRRK